MNIVLDTLIFVRQKRGGVSEYWFQFIKRMLEDDEITLYFLERSGNYKHEGFKMLNKKNTTIIAEKNYPIQVLQNINAMPRGLENEKFIFHSTTSTRICSYKNAINIAVIHDFTHQLKFFGFKKILQKCLNTWQKNRIIRNSNGIICISDNTKKDLLKFYPNTENEKVILIYNGANDIYRILDENILPEKYHRIKNKRYILFVGDRFGYKNFQFVLNILRKNDQLYCAVVGGGDFNKNEQSQINQMNNRCIRYTNVSDEDLNELYNGAHCLIYPSLYEGFGIPILEAMKSGCPVITFNNSSLPEVLCGSGILLNENDLDGCLYYLDKLSNQNYRNEIIRKQYEMSKRFSWDKAYNELKNFYHCVYKRTLSSI